MRRLYVIGFDVNKNAFESHDSVLDYTVPACVFLNLFLFFIPPMAPNWFQEFPPIPLSCVSLANIY
jgi:hypothetical protein